MFVSCRVDTENQGAGLLQEQALLIPEPSLWLHGAKEMCLHVSSGLSAREFTVHTSAARRQVPGNAECHAAETQRSTPIRAD